MKLCTAKTNAPMKMKPPQGQQKTPPEQKKSYTYQASPKSDYVIGVLVRVVIDITVGALALISNSSFWIQALFGMFVDPDTPKILFRFYECNLEDFDLRSSIWTSPGYENLIFICQKFHKSCLFSENLFLSAVLSNISFLDLDSVWAQSRHPGGLKI